LFCISREDLEKSERIYITKGKKNQSDVYIIEKDGKKIVIKDYKHKESLTKILGVIFSYIEFRNYKKVNRVLDCFPRAYCMPDRYSIAIEYIDGNTINIAEENENYCFVIEKIQHCLKKMHSKNIFHLDLRKRGNIIIKGSDIYFIDLASMLVISNANPLIVLKPLLSLIDNSCILKWKQYICPQRLSKNDLKKLKLYNLFRTVWIFSKHKTPTLKR